MPVSCYVVSGSLHQDYIESHHSCPGAISDYSESSYTDVEREELLSNAPTDGKPKGLTGYLNLIAQSARMEGFIMYVHSRGYKPSHIQIWTPR